ncbi:uncharacterized protein PFL1_05074 [Pseudozyma flocculosa PF-1]|uniref:Secreted protein n=2 Tax=Pseudozyma flocculosa TaxID=84751 RepID=A0A5C3EY29_9BASI|nr:uncharacterized protein PFL1_05074 [Pseudozyma flocculosa PF-1]EPQ27536.1 hypothetical protein PFL1_05074 [Pseudozyma flocculosa PF-1]SPO36029.1 uncharacterized protein PSFLO_01500 [Pseudozyma flocculosa]
MMLPRLPGISLLSLTAAVVLSATHARTNAASAKLTGRRARNDSFSSPRAGVRWRHWIQDACLEDAALQRDVAAMADVGSEGFELLSYQSYGQRGPTLLDPTRCSFGSDHFSDVFVDYVEAARQHGMVMDWAMGPNQAAGVPVPPDQVDRPGFNTELVLGISQPIAAGSSNAATTLPEPQIVPVTGYDGLVNFTAPITKRKLEGAVAVQLVPGANLSAPALQVDWSTLVDLSGAAQDGKPFNYTAPAGQDSVIVSFYSRRNGYPEAVPGFDGAIPGQPGSYGSYIQDHFSLAGAQIAIEANEDVILKKAAKALAKDGVGKSIWTDSNEFRAQLYWTDQVRAEFEKDHGYPIAYALPALFGGARPFGGANTPKKVLDYGATIDSERFRNDFKETLTRLYVEYGRHLAQWARKRGMAYSDQPAYNFQLDISLSSTVADVPECESLGQPSIDLIRQFTGGVNLAHRDILSSEMGAGRFEAYEFRMIQLFQDSRLAFAGGVNQIIIHGLPSSTNYVQTSWPGLTPFVYEFSEMHGPRQPGWKHYGQYMEILAREMWLLRRGTRKLDVVVLRYGWDLRAVPDKTQKHVVFATPALEEAGYSYDYVSALALQATAPKVKDGRLDPDGPAYKALVLNRASNITVAGIRTVLDYAQAGLPVVVLGDAPSDVPGFDANGTRKGEVQKAVQTLLGLKNVKSVAQESEVASALAELDVTPSAASNSTDAVVSDASTIKNPNDPLVVLRRHDRGQGSAKSSELYYVFNSGAPRRFNVTFEVPSASKAHGFLLDQRTGTTRSLAQMVRGQGGDSVTINGLELASNQTAMFAFTTASVFQDARAPQRLLESIDGDVRVQVAPRGDRIEAQLFGEGQRSYKLGGGSDNTGGTLDFSLHGAEAVEVKQWELSIDAWAPSSNLSSVETDITPHPNVPLPNGLVPWDQLDGHYNTSGVGTYTSTFDWGFAGNDDTVGAELRQPLVYHTQKTWINDVLLPTFDPTSPKQDVSRYLKKGSNTIRIEVATPLLNALNALDDNLVMSVGYTRARKLAEGRVKRGHQSYGLVGPVEVVPFAKASIAL